MHACALKFSKIYPFDCKLYDWAYGSEIEKQQLPAIAELVRTSTRNFSSAHLPELIILKDRLDSLSITKEQAEQLIQRIKNLKM
jgi:hypothetical protein